VPNNLDDYRIPGRVKIFRWFARPIFRLIFFLISEVQITGIENIPASGSYIIAINHISIIEPPFVIAFWPVAPEAVGAKEIWDRKGQSLLARLYGGIQVHRGEFDRQLIEKMITAVSANHPLLIAPEGGRSHTPGLRPGFPGVAYLADKAKVSILPVGIIGSTDDFLTDALKFKRPVLEMKIGEILTLPEVVGKGEQRRKELQNNTDLIMYKIADLLPASYQGVYAKNEYNSTQTTQPNT
jgi:1-acyl-sn-glycerol-3-phosphate acyltransferase